MQKQNAKYLESEIVQKTKTLYSHPCFGKWQRFWSSRWYKISPWSAEIQMHLGQGKRSHRSCSIKVGLLKHFATLTGTHLCWSFFLIKLQVFRSATLLIQVFSYEYCEILKTPILKIICVRLLLTRHTKTICFLFLEKCLLSKPNFPSFRFLSIFS